ncbi:restriction endonuclease subunit S [Listeria innocua]|uniref:restriction endonuclease subunit S n=1 Tax=Listeria innocua TaxID=1642 RepID=UPI0016237E13|nr:restriction endonuclease subunit S [Listeria innocua]MBC1337498.1 restriction endonuclease subunit S [Listeria innocua]
MLPLFYLISHYSNLPFRAWEQRKLGKEVENVATGRSTFFTSIEQSSETPYAVLGSTSVISYDKNFDHSGDFILTARVGANAGNLYKYSGDVKISDNTVYIQAKSLDFVYYLLNKFDLKRLSFGTGQPLVKASELKNLKLMFPNDEEEQQKIGKFFKYLDDTIALHQRKLDALKLMKKAFSQQIFPENNRKKPKIRFTSFYEEWEQRKIGEYGYFYYGKSAPKWSVAQDATTPCVRYGELYTKFGPEIDIVHSYTNIDKSNLKFSSGNEVLVPRVGENPLDFANCSWLSISNVAIGEMISVYNTEQYPLFIAYYFRSKMKYEFAKRVEGGNVSNLYYSYLEDILISVPSIEEQNKIAEFLNKIDITINLLQNKLDRIKELKKAYLQNMFI